MSPWGDIARISLRGWGKSLLRWGVIRAARILPGGDVGQFLSKPPVRVFGETRLRGEDAQNCPSEF
jgi:hypothetical protein